MATPSKVVPWSYSGLKLFKTCPRKYFAEKVEKSIPYEESPAAAIGNFIHKALENHIRVGTPLPVKLPDGAPFPELEPVVESIKGIPGSVFCELKLGLTRDLKACDFFSKNVWFRSVADLLKIKDDRAWVIDYKTGSAKYPDKTQLELMAMAVMGVWPKVNVVHGALVFLQEPSVVKIKVTRDELPALWAKWRQEVDILEKTGETNIWTPTPNGLCRSWCRVTQCEYNGV
jgi:hypothetical protein